MQDINVYTGPMKCGKSKKLIKEARKYYNEGINIKMFKPIIDNRFSNNKVMDRDGNNFPAINIEKIEDIENYDAEIYFIDEFQFLKGNVDTIQKLASKGKKFFISGLNLTAENKPFGKMGELMNLSNNVEMMKSRCECCNSNEAIYSYCKTSKDGDILIGDSEYIPVCSNCYKILMNQNKKIFT